MRHYVIAVDEQEASLKPIPDMTFRHDCECKVCQSQRTTKLPTLLCSLTYQTQATQPCLCVCVCVCADPPTKVMFIPDKDGNKPDLLVSSKAAY